METAAKSDKLMVKGEVIQQFAWMHAWVSMWFIPQSRNTEHWHLYSCSNKHECGLLITTLFNVCKFKRVREILHAFFPFSSVCILIDRYCYHECLRGLSQIATGNMKGSIKSNHWLEHALNNVHVLLRVCLWPYLIGKQTAACNCL